jgi:serine/threonine protein kinase
MEESRVLGWVIQVLDTLNYLHTLPKPITGRDTKPDNLIVNSDGHTILINFGLIKQIEREFEMSDL